MAALTSTKFLWATSGEPYGRLATRDPLAPRQASGFLDLRVKILPFVLRGRGAGWGWGQPKAGFIHPESGASCLFTIHLSLPVWKSRVLHPTSKSQPFGGLMDHWSPTNLDSHTYWYPRILWYFPLKSYWLFIWCQERHYFLPQTKHACWQSAVSPITN